MGTQSAEDFKEIHSLMGMLQNLDVGLVILDREYKIQLWNSFMESHSGLMPYQVRDKSLFEMFSEINEDWFRHKAESVFLLNNRAFTTWEQRPYLFKFKNYRPITGKAEFMYQNATIIPLGSADGRVERIGLIIYDVTDVAVNRVELKAANDELKRLSRTDRLTGLYNRGFWEECLGREFKRCKRTGSVSSMMIFDIDHFKKVNDEYGHPTGDEVIKAAAEALNISLRETDVAGRYGGEEYVVILVNTSAEQAMIYAERLRKLIEQTPVSHLNQTVNYTVSLGIAEINDDIASHEEWIEYADKALYRSKEGGRNQANVYS
ncbi:diguanylate cyclase [Catenovulum sp. SM1970]|uniref:sensor domain-containing diguanylate cyclase n=1 Tax=Marinifaba aquimaris TaxID=2741323 RepID=UPI0015742D8D|nr:diguanylate cyclase [Marinifaba aquimaris]NTS75497.1 diguanylate cyclase [Marinifaba aquimaris]